MKPVLVFIAPLWNSELEELLQVTKESFAVKVLTQKQSLSYEDPFVEVLQCFESYSPLELAKLLPWILQLNFPKFHVILPPKANSKQLASIGAVLSMARSHPKTQITHSPWPQGSWSFPIWIKAFQNLFDGTLCDVGKRTLSLTHHPKIELRTNSKSLDLVYRQWVFPSQKGFELAWQALINCLLNRRENILEFWNWDKLPIRKQNRLRQEFLPFWDQFRSNSPRGLLEDWRNVQFLVLIGNIKEFPFSESDLLDLCLFYEVNLILDASSRQKLKGPWKDGDNFWLWNPTQIDSEDRPWNNPYVLLPFTTKQELKGYRDQLTNHILRSFMKV
jgi:hypothetical protein